ncbi:hypothetical protein P5673_010459, partial [Acropora cervicornis]
MDATKDPEPKVQFSEKANDSLKKPCRRKTKIIALAAITVTVRFRVLNKTSEEYWFLTKFNFSDVHVEGNMEIGRITSLTEYFLVRLLTHSRKTKFPIEVHGDRHTNTELIRLVYGILGQLIPTLKRDLCECVDGQKANILEPEESPLLPRSVKMHREANTTDKDK